MVKAFAQNVERVYFYLAHSVNVYIRILTSRLWDPSCPLQCEKIKAGHSQCDHQVGL